MFKINFVLQLFTLMVVVMVVGLQNLVPKLGGYVQYYGKFSCLQSLNFILENLVQNGFLSAKIDIRTVRITSNSCKFQERPTM